MLGNLDEVIQNNLIKDYELIQIITALTNFDIKPLKFIGLCNDFVAIETKDPNECYNKQTLIAKKEKVNYVLIDKTIKQSPQRRYISQQSTNEYELIHIPSAKYSLNTQNITKKFKEYDKKKLIEIFTSILYNLIDMQNDGSYLGITKDSILFKRDGSIFLNEFNFMSQDKIKYLIENRYNDQHLMYLPQEILQNGFYNSSSDIYTLGLFFLEILGLQFDNDVAQQLSNSNYQITNYLIHQDLVNIITQYMICQDLQKRASSKDLFWLFRFSIEDELNISEICMFIQSNIEINLSKAINDIQNSSKQLNKQRLIVEYKKDFDRLINLEHFYQNGCIVTSLQETQMQILIIGNIQSEFENKYIQVNLELELPNTLYPYESPLITLESRINSILCNQKTQSLNIFAVDGWSPASSIKSSILSLVSLLNTSVQEIILYFYCEDHRNEQNKQLLKEEMNKLENINTLLSKYKIEFFQKLSK
ncbi:hypothetical protein ABPG74_012668 [Tetrahymena malaccensis]